MSNRKVVEVYYSDISNLADLLSKLVSSYRLLVGSADELNKIALAKRSQVKETLKRVDKLGDIIDNVIKTLDQSSCDYTNYCKMKAKVMECNLKVDYIKNEIEQEMKLNQ